ncbi:hypothetical protein [Chryseobacterium polytrichastri]|uniref:Chaperone of endosialidase n=1 Tax=Chryseobacterium polytrichastri TaxID=1302687 RepID=A0A1M6UYF7_9FLAO|nr:hypothetical protein [Chryseobacterium polytrichastri]SHK74248.1 hypothetical protein SAMN05444267_100785 [Chryseobacterium polytrichastri]
MAKRTITQLKEYFKVGKRPTENQFGDLIDSYVHVDASSEYSTSVEFPASYQVGDYIEFLEFLPEMASASGFYEISIAYTRNNIASAATHLAATSHANPNAWRECGAINKNNYVDDSGAVAFTIDVNGSARRFRIRAIKVLGATNEAMSVVIKVRSINKNSSWLAIDNRGSNTASVPLQPMSNEWNLWVGSLHTNESAKVALKVNTNGDVGIGTNEPKSKLDVRGTVFAGSGDGTQGVNAFAIRYEDGSLNNWGSLRSSAETYMSYGVRANPYGALKWLSTNGAFPNYNTAIITGGEGVKFLASNYQQTAFDYPVDMFELMRINPNGNVGIGTDSPKQKLDVKGVVLSQVSSNEGGALFLENASKTTPGTANRWAMYNMTGGYGNGLQFWSYSDNGDYGVKLMLSDKGNMALYGKLEAKDVVITQTPTADFVFAPDYNLRGIHDLDKFISEKNHLPEIPSAKEMTEKGLAVGDFQIKLLQKIEELTLYIISLKKEMDSMKLN